MSEEHERWRPRNQDGGRSVFVTPDDDSAERSAWTGQVRRPIDYSKPIVETEGAYYFVANDKKINPEVLAFEEWVLAQFPRRERGAAKEVAAQAMR